jgi:uncharacterized repeat protein (TIGR02543 family)
MLKILLRKTISSLMLMTLALFLVSFNNNNFEKNERNNFETQQNILNTEGANVSVAATNGLNAAIYNWNNETVGSLRSTTTLSNLAYGPTSNNILNSGTNVNFYTLFTGYIVPTHDNMWFRALADDGVRIRLGPNPSNTTLFYNDWVYQGVDENFQAQFATQANVPLYFQLEFMQGGGPWGLDLRWSTSNSNYSTIPTTAFFLSPPTSTMTFNPNGGTAVGTIIAERNLPFTLPANPTRPGYTFNRWNYSNGTTVSTSVFPLTNTTVDAVWDANQYTVTFDRRGGTGGDGSRTATFAAVMPTPNTIAPTRNGYMFDGYFSGINGTGTQYYNANMTSARNWDLTSNTTLYASWAPASYTVTLNKNNGTSGSDSVSAVYESAMPSITPPTRSGLTFLGYFDSITGGNQYYNINGTSFRTWNYSEPRTLFARWGLVGTVTFNTIGNTLWNVPAGVTSINYLVVAGGGGGGNAFHNGGGGGGAAGMVLSGTLSTIPTTSYAITVGAGGSGGQFIEGDSSGQNGLNSVFDNIIAIGGIGGQASRVTTPTARYTGGASQIINTTSARPGGGGGGGGSGGGGGGATGSGSNGSGTSGGSGGAGLVSTISGSSVTYGVGGAGGGYGTSVNGSNGTANTGNGGNAGRAASSSWASGGNGGSGIVIISYSEIVTDYTLTFDKQNGTGGTDSATAIFNSAMPTATAPTRSGYSFLGYFDSITDGTQYYSNLMVSSRNWDKTQETTLYARWQANNTVITFNGNGSTSGTMNTQSIATDSSANLIVNSFSRSGFIFNGWNTQANGTGTSFANLASYTASGETTLTLFAQWSANSNQIIFNGNNSSSGSMLAQGLNTGVTANLNANQFERTGYTFAGWNTLANGLGTNFANQASYTMGTDASYELFAKWTANTYTITFDLQSGSGGDTTRTATFDAAMPTPNTTAPTRSGFTFNGYFSETNGSGNKYYNANMSSARNFDLTSNTTLFASWTADTFTITLNPSGGSGGDATRTATFGAAMPTPNTTAPTRSGYTFNGYYSGVNGTGTIYYNNLMQSQRNFDLTADTTLYAKWTAFIPLAKSSLNDASIFNFTDASNAYVLPVVSGNEIVLTTGGAQASAFFLRDKIVQTDGFSTYFEIKQYRTSNSMPADGLVFVLARDTNTLGAAGGGLGYQGIVNSIGVGFDNHKNGSEPDPVFTTVYKDGVLGLWQGNQSIRYDTSFVTNYAAAAVDSLVRTYKVSINYSKASKTLHFKIDVAGTISTFDFTNLDVPDEYFAGFSAGTGGASVKFAIPTWYFANRYYPDGIDPNTSNAVYVEDKTVPTAPTTINLTRTTGSNASFVLSGATDNNGVINYQYSFDGTTWLDYSGDNLDIFDTTTNRTLYARAFDGAGNLSPSTNITTRFDLTFNSNLGSDVASVSEMANSSITRPADPTRAGYSFVNWHSDAELNNVFDFSSGISANTIIYAKWQGLPYTVTFDKQLGTSGDNSAEVTFGSAMTSADAPTIFGYNFAGYFSQANGQGTQYYNASMNSTNNWNITQNSTLFASWNAKTIAISFNNGTGASVTNAVNATFAQPMPAATKPTLTGHDFMGYYTQASAQGIQYYDENMNSLLNWESETATTLFAYYTPSDFNITFNSNQGNNPSFSSKIVIYNQLFGELPTIDRIGYDFIGWFDDISGGNQITSSSEVLITDDLDYFARWTPKTFTITFDKGLGSDGTNSVLASYEAELPQIIAPTRSGYTFEGYINSTGTLVYSKKLESLVVYSFLENITLYAEWNPNQYNITFDPYGGTLTGFASKQVTFDLAYGTLTTATREGHTFLGWYTSSIAGFEVRSTDINTSFMDQTLYARWSINQYRVIFNTNGGNGLEPILINYGSVISVPNAVKSGGYEFVAWSPALPATMPANDLTLTAIYTRMIVGNDFSVTNINSNFKDGLIRFSLGVADPTARIFVDNEVNLANPGSNINAGVISRNGSDLYYGTGTSVIKFGEVDSTFNGNNGSDLLVNINSTVLFTNGNFDNDFSNWTTNNSSYPINNNSRSNMTYQSTIVNEGGNKYARLYIAGSTDPRGSVHGPSLTSSPFSAKPGDTISFRWRADANSDDYDVYAFLDNGGVMTQLLYSRGGTQSTFQTREITLTQGMLPGGLTNNLKFIFVSGSYDRTGGRVVGATFYIDDVSIVDNGVTANVINNLIKNIKYSGVENNQFIDIRTVDSNNVNNYYLFNNESIQDQTEESNLNLRTSYSFMQNEDFSLKIDLSRYFSNSNNIAYTIVDPLNNLDNFVSINNNILNGNGNNSKVGNNTVYIKATSDNYQSSIIAFEIEIININDAPIINPVYQNFRIPIPFNQTFVYFIPDDFMLDPDIGTNLTYTVTGSLPIGISFKQETRSFSGSCNSCDLSNLITITASDGLLSVSDNNIGFTSSLTVLFETNGGTIIPSQTIESGQAVIRPEVDPTRTGYSFTGWYFDPSLSLVYDFTSTPPYGSVYAKWTPNKYNVTFMNPNGQIIYQSLLDFNTSISIPPSPTNEGKLFNGWSPAVDSSVPAYDVVYTALFRNKEFGFRIHENHSLALAPTLVIAEFGDDIEQALEPPIRLGYTFKGWFSDIEMRQPINVPKIMPDLGEDGTIINLYASWEPTKYSINYIGMLVPNSLNPAAYTIESELIRFNTNLSSSSIIFLGFFDNPDFLGLPITRILSGSTGVVNLYANFTSPSYELRFVDNLGNTLSSQQVRFGSIIDTSYLPSVEKEGYDFIGWSSNLPSTMPDTNVVVTAVFKPKEYKLTVTDFNGDIIFSEMFEVNEPLSGVDLPILDVEGFEFENWEPQLPSTMPAADLQIVSKYRELPKFKIIIYGTQDEVISEFEFKEKEEIKNVVLPDLSSSNDFVFEGWDKELPSIMPAENIEIRPLGIKKLAMLNLYSADRTLISSIEAQVGSNLTLIIPTRLGYNFQGWLDENGTLVVLSTMPEKSTNLFASWQAKIYSIQVTVGSNDFNINVTFGEPIGNIVSPQLFGFRFEGWKNNLTGEFLNSNTIFTTPEEINLVPVYTRLNAGETLIAATRLISDFILRLFR